MHLRIKLVSVSYNFHGIALVEELQKVAKISKNIKMRRV